MISDPKALIKSEIPNTIDFGSFKYIFIRNRNKRARILCRDNKNIKMTNRLKIICAGLIGWDNIGRTDLPMIIGNDLPGKIDTHIGGVAANIAMALANRLTTNPNFEVVLLSSIGNDQKSDLLLSTLSKHYKINCNFVIREEGTSDGYICIESNGELFGAISSSAQLQKSCVKIFEPLVEHQKVEINSLFSDYLIVDSNLTTKAIDYLTFDPFFDDTKFIIACASPYKAKKVRSLMINRRCKIYTNLEEASAILGKRAHESCEAANNLFDLGASEATVTNGKKQASNRSKLGLVNLTPEDTFNVKATGAGDAFLTAHFLSLIFNKGLSQLEHLKIAELAARKEISSIRES